ncbi:MAG: SIS domain-containing protein, partial [Alphaproteobacteria bacterium]
MQKSRMLQEALEAPGRVATLLATAEGDLRALGRVLRGRGPTFAMTVARGSSDHAANFARYLIEASLGLVTASAAPSVVTVYGARLRLEGAAVMAISQSGESPDILSVMELARVQGAVTLGITNAPRSPLAGVVEHVLDVHAGRENSVAATKSVIATLTALAALVAHWAEDRPVLEALPALPERLSEAASSEWPGMEVLREAPSVLVVARGRGYPIAQEIALKFKETCALHAEPFSSAELLHGPVRLVGRGFPVVVLATADAALAGVREVLRALRRMGAHLLVASPLEEVLAEADTALPLPGSLDPVLDPIVAAQAFYPFLARLAAARGLDPDNPPHLEKVTR